MNGFDKKAIRRWRRDVWRAFEADGFGPAKISAAMVLAAVAVVGTGVQVLSELTGLSEGYVTTVLRRLRRQRVLVGQTLRVGWDDKDAVYGNVSVVLDAMVATGDLERPVDPKRSAAHKARAPDTRARGPRRKMKAAQSVGAYTPKRQRSNPLYSLPGWEDTQKAKA